MSNEREAGVEILDNLRRVFQAIHDYSRSAEKMTGLTAHQLWALKILSKDTPLRVSDLARAMHLRPPTVVGILDRLEAKGFVLRSTAPNDRRVVLLQPTHQALKLVADAPDVAQNILLQGLSELNDDELYCVQQGMRLMTRLLQAEHLVPQPLHS